MSRVGCLVFGCGWSGACSALNKVRCLGVGGRLWVTCSTLNGVLDLEVLYEGF